MAVDASETTATARTFPQLLVWRAESTPEGVAVRQRARGVWREWTWRELAVAASELGDALLSSGVEAGQAVAFLGGPCLEGLLFVLAAQGIGAVPCGLHPWFSPEEVHSALDDVGATFFLAHSQEFIDALMAGSELPRLRTVAVADQSGMFGDEYGEVVRWPDLIQRGRARQAERPEEWGQRVERGRLDDACGIYLTIGDDGTRAAVLTYANVLAGWFQALSGVEGLPSPPGKRDRLFHDTPIAHIHGAVFGIFLTLVHGAPSHVPDIHDSFSQARMEVSPTYAVASSRAWEQRVAQTADLVRASSRVHRTVFKVAMASCGLTVARDGTPRRALWRRMIAAFGYVAAVRPMLDQWGLLRVRHASVAGGELSPEVARQWRAWGLELRNYYGLPETAGVVAVRAPGSAGLHTLRAVIPGVDVTISADQELLVRGANVATNCWKDGLVPNDRIDAGGWLHTGDVGSVEEGQQIVGTRDEDVDRSDTKSLTKLRKEGT